MGDLIEEVRDLYYHDNQPPYWNKKPNGPNYSELNNVKEPTEVDIIRYQIERVQEFQKTALATRARNVEEINQLFKDNTVNTLLQGFDSKQKKGLEAAISGIVGTINGMMFQKSGSYKDGTVQYKWEGLRKNLLSLQSQLQNIQTKLGGRLGSGVYKNDLDRLSNALAACELKNLSSVALQEWFNNLNNIKGELVEEIGTAWLNKLETPNIKTIRVGNVNLNTTGINGRHGGQLAQDMIVVDMTAPDLDTKMITYNTTGGKSKTVSIREFLNKMDSINGQEKHITIDDPSYTNLLSLSTMNIQAKAGFNQMPWNAQSAYTHVSIQEFQEEASFGGLGIKKVFNLLHSLNTENPKGQWIKEHTSPTYNALANYGLATVLYKILHLSGPEGNQYLLTPQGFISYPERVKYLLEKHQTAIKISGNVAIGNDTLTHKYSASIPKYWQQNK